MVVTARIVLEVIRKSARPYSKVNLLLSNLVPLNIKGSSERMTMRTQWVLLILAFQVNRMSVLTA